MLFHDFIKLHGDSLGDPLIAWIDDPSTTDADVMEQIGPEPWQLVPGTPDKDSERIWQSIHHND